MSDSQGCSRLGGQAYRGTEARGLPTGAETRRRQLTGRTAHLSGRAAEDQVAAFLQGRGLAVIARRWRGGSGEIDLVCETAGTTVFVEVKRAASLEAAAHSLLPRQIARIRAAASEFVAGLPAGQDSDMRFDVALVDERGMIEIIENALGP